MTKPQFYNEEKMNNQVHENEFYIYVDPNEDITGYPECLTGDMSVFKGFKFEVQWLFYLMLMSQGIKVKICREYPRKGILIIHKGNVRKFIWNPDLFVVSGQWDWPRDDRAQLHLVANNYTAEKSSLGVLDRLSFSGRQYYVAPVTHPVIIPRERERGDRFENIAFIGDPKNLDPAFLTGMFEDRLREMGMKFIIISDPAKMSDFSDVDATIAVRKIGKVITNKPPTKLTNAWRGDVPSILGCEVGFREMRESEFDFLEVDSVEDAIKQLKKLKENIDLRRRMIENGRRRALAHSAEEQSRLWAGFFKNVVAVEYEEWCSRPLIKKYTFLLVRRVRHQLRNTISNVRDRILRIRASYYR